MRAQLSRQELAHRLRLSQRHAGDPVDWWRQFRPRPKAGRGRVDVAREDNCDVGNGAGSEEENGGHVHAECDECKLKKYFF